MVDVGAKRATRRVAVASGRIQLGREAFRTVLQGGAKKGDVLGVARVAAIQAVKRTAVEFELDAGERCVRIVATVQCNGQTGVEMEALTAVAVGLLTTYDMLKAVDRGMTMGDVRLEAKRGGKSGTYRRQAEVRGSIRRIRE